MRSSAPAPPVAAQIPTTIVLARFDDLLAGGLLELIKSDPGLAIVADYVEQARMSVVLRAHQPDVAILNVDALAKLADVRDLSARHPDTRLVLLADALSTVEAAQLLAFGASACLSRDTQARDVLTAIHLASRGLQVIPRAPASSGASIADGYLLTRREAEVLPMLQQGRSNPQIALALHVEVETVRSHARNIYRKLGVSSRRELVRVPEGNRERWTATAPIHARATGNSLLGGGAHEEDTTCARSERGSCRSRRP
jgi:DNA-binding NarL/FixJ family response regulator